MLSLLAAGLSLFFLATDAPEQAPQVLWADGEVQVSGFGGVKEVAVTAGELQGAFVTLLEPGVLWALDSSGVIYGLRGPGRYHIHRQKRRGADRPAFTPVNDEVADVVTVRERFSLPDVSDGISRTQRAETAGAIDVSATPRDTAIAEDSPVLRWTGNPGQAFDLLLEARGADGVNYVQERWRGLRLGTLKPRTSLKTGRWYRWTLTPSPPDLWTAAAASLVPFGPPWVSAAEAAGSGEARATQREGYWFRILPAAQRETVSAMIARCDKLQDAPEGIGPAAGVLRALILERAGLLQAAEDAWRALATAHPSDAGITARLSAVTYRSYGPAPPEGQRLTLLAPFTAELRQLAKAAARHFFP